MPLLTSPQGVLPVRAHVHVAGRQRVTACARLVVSGQATRCSSAQPLARPRVAPRAHGRTHTRATGPRAEAAKPEDKPGFGYTRLDAILVSVGLPLVGFALHAGLMSTGMDTTTAGNVVLVVLVGGLTLAWTATYVGRVVSKDMTYVKQLDAYEQAVMAKRLEELPETELSQLLGEVDAERLRREKKDSSKPQE